MKPSDASLSRTEYEKVRTKAREALLSAGAFGRFPTPIADLMAAAHLEEPADEALEEGLIARLRRVAGGALKRAASKVVGIFHAPSRRIFVDLSLNRVRQTFVRLHEMAHGFLPWQKDIYAVVEDCDKSLAPEVADLFDRQANVFAAEVLFQLDGFIGEASVHEFGIRIPLKLSRKYGASAYSAIREYVRKNLKPCAVLVLNPPVAAEGVGFVATLRRVEVSETFAALCGPVAWRETFTANDPLGAMVPIGGRRMSGKRYLEVVDARGDRHDCVAEAFTQGYQVFVLLLVNEKVSPAVVAPWSHGLTGPGVNAARPRPAARGGTSAPSSSGVDP